MHRQIVYPGAIPLETDILNAERNTMIALGRFIQDVLGSSTVASGLACLPTSPASLSVKIGAGALYSLQNVDNSAFSSLVADTVNQIMKQGIVLTSDAVQLSMTAPTTAGYSVIYLIEAAFAEVDANAIVLSYYNASNPTVPYSGPAGSGAAQYTIRQGTVNLVAKPGIAAASPTPPSVDTGFVPLYYVTIAYGATTITSGNIAVATGAPFITGGFASASSLSLYALINSPAFTGAPTAPTPTGGDNSTRIATTAFVNTAIGGVSGFAPLASPTFTGNPAAPTQSTADNSTKLATTAYVKANLVNYLGLGGGTLTGALIGTTLTLTGFAATTPVAVTAASSTTIACGASNVFAVAMGTNITTLTVGGPTDGQTINVFFTQDATGSRTVTWPSSFKWPGGTAGVLSTAANAVDLLVATYRAATGFWYCSLGKAFA